MCASLSSLIDHMFVLRCRNEMAFQPSTRDSDTSSSAPVQADGAATGGSNPGTDARAEGGDSRHPPAQGFVDNASEKADKSKAYTPQYGRIDGVLYDLRPRGSDPGPKEISIEEVMKRLIDRVETGREKVAQAFADAAALGLPYDGAFVELRPGYKRVNGGLMVTTTVYRFLSGGLHKDEFSASAASSLGGAMLCTLKRSDYLRRAREARTQWVAHLQQLSVYYVHYSFDTCTG